MNNKNIKQEIINWILKQKRNKKPPNDKIFQKHKIQSEISHNQQLINQSMNQSVLSSKKEDQLKRQTSDG